MKELKYRSQDLFRNLRFHFINLKQIALQERDETENKIQEMELLPKYEYKNKACHNAY